MLVVCALALVVAAAAFLVIGLAAGDVGDLYLSMVLCVASLVVVAVSARLSRTRPAPAASEPPAPVVPPGAEEVEAAHRPDDELWDGPIDRPGPRVDGPAPALGARLAKVDARDTADDGSMWAAAPVAVLEAPREVEADREVEDEVAPAPDPAPVVEPEVEAPAVAATAAPADDAIPFPIADYDALAPAQILPLVGQLWPEEIPVVAERERATKARPAVLDALAAAAGDPSLGFPIAEYESLDTEQITRLLAPLDASDLATVQAAERSGPARVGVLVAVANQLAARS